MPDGKPANEFAFNAEPKNKEFAEKIIAGTHESWKKLISGVSEAGGLSVSNTSLSNQASIDQAAAQTALSQVNKTFWQSFSTCGFYSGRTHYSGRTEGSGYRH